MIFGGGDLGESQLIFAAESGVQVFDCRPIALIVKLVQHAHLDNGRRQNPDKRIAVIQQTWGGRREIRMFVIERDSPAVGTQQREQLCEAVDDVAIPGVL